MLELLIATHHYFDLTGSETFVYTLAKALVMKGCKTTIYSPYIGGVITDKTRELGVVVTNNLNDLGHKTFDLAQVSHNLIAYEIRSQFPDLPMIFLSHGVLPSLEHPPIDELNITTFLAVSEEVKANLIAHGVSENRIFIFRNIIDTDRFSPLKPIGEKPQRALIISRHIDNKTKLVIEEACKCLNIDLSHIGKENIVFEVEKFVNEVDLVFSLGRGILESMSCGRPSIVMGYNGSDGLVTPENVDEIQGCNFSGRKFKKTFSVDELISEIENYRQDLGAVSREIVLQRFSAKRNIDTLLKVYAEARARFQPDRTKIKGLRYFVDSILESRRISDMLSRRDLLKEIEEKERLLREREALLREREAEVKRLKAIVAEMDALMQQIQSSDVWRLLTKYFMIDSLLPISETQCGKLESDEKITLEKIENLNFPFFDQPIVSIIIPVFNKWQYTYQCLDSLIKYTDEVPFEVIVVDNASTDETPKMLTKVRNIKEINNKSNFGFVKACNIGAKKAQGKYLLFLNNDTQVTKGWLKSMVELAEKDKSVGLVGAKLIYPNGKLQEAGGIVWNDAVKLAWNYGRQDDPDKWEYNYVKEVDYCSGACLLVRKDLFETVGLFDEEFSPAYCEDTDLAFSVRKLGYKVMYQPKAKVIHFEGITAGVDTSQGFKSYQVVNQEKFYKKWKDTLEREHYKNGENVFLARDRSQQKKIMLFIDRYVPTHDKDAGSVKLYNYLNIFLDMGFKIIFWPDNLYKMEPYTSELQQLGIEVVYGLQDFRKFIKNYGKYIEVAYLVRPNISIKYIDLIKKYSNARVIYDCQDLHYLREQRRAEIENNPKLLKESKNLKIIEFYLMENSDISVVLSDIEKGIIKKENPKINVMVLPYIQPFNGVKKSFKDKKDLIFIGGFAHKPNEDGVLWFVNEIFPLVKKAISKVGFIILGNHPTERILKLKSDDIVVTGYVQDVSPYFQNAKLFVAPLRYGAGLKGKIVHAMSYGLPVVTTSIGAEGMNLKDGENVLIADDPREFAKRVLVLYENKDLWEKLSKNSVEYVKKNNSPSAARQKFEEVFEKLGLGISVQQKGIISPKQEADMLFPVAVVRNREEFEEVSSLDILTRIKAYEDELIKSWNTEVFTVEGFCLPCNKAVRFIVDRLCGASCIDGRWVPNWRERLVCPLCHLNNRQRLMAAVVRQHLKRLNSLGAIIYCLEYVTPFYKWAKEAFSVHKVIGSEYLGHKYSGGAVINGIRHEDVMALSFEDRTIDLIVSSDVFEHVPNPVRAFSECARVLKPGGVMLATFPFHSNNKASVARATLNDEELTYLLPPVYHGDPMSAEGSLVFTDFGWDVLDKLKEAGFMDVRIEVYASEKYGHLGGGQLIFRAIKRATDSPGFSEI